MSRRSPLLVLVGLLLLHVNQVAGIPPIELEIITASGPSALSAQDWARALQSLPIESVRIHSERGRTQAEIIPIGEGPSLRYRVIGVINDRNQLIVPGGQFRTTEIGKLKVWLEHLDNRQGSARAKYAFGFEAQQLVDVTSALAVPLAVETKGRSLKSVLREVHQLVKPKLKLGPSAVGKIADNDVVSEELLGVSAGTTLAAILRPLGLVMVPQLPHASASGEMAELMVVDVREAKESWPVGWPREANSTEMVPKWMEFVEVAIDDFSLSEALAILQSRLEIPFLMDHNGMARQRIDPQTTRVSYPAKRMIYGRIVRSLLTQAKLRGEIRADEAGNPFLWISPLRP